LNKPDRKALIREYKESPRPAGIFQVKNVATGRLLIGASPDLPGMLNRQRFQLESGTHPDKELQADWDELGPDDFEFTILDRLEPGEDADAPSQEDLRMLHEMWMERLAGSDWYPKAARGTR
jgi:hypothetical protein